MKLLIVPALPAFSLVTPLTASAQQAAGEKQGTTGSYGFIGSPHSWDDPKNRPIDAKGVETRSKDGQAAPQKTETAQRPSASVPVPKHLHGSYGIAK
ncbi:MAG: hypothetical protein ABFD98_15570 [Syntrophobacteraceae bacterium]|nr:hypothetical protein [Desulfobacteraceae bacterium]